MPKIKLGKNVLEASKERIEFLFDNFEKVICSFSGGKDSTVMTHLVADEARKRGRKFALLFIDWEAQLNLTIEHVRDIYKEYEDCIEPYWICIPLMTNNSCSYYEQTWKSWDENKRHLWVREKEPMAICSQDHFPFYYENITFEEFLDNFSVWYSQGKSCVSLVGLRTDESLNRWRVLFRSVKESPYKSQKYIADFGKFCRAFPIYDWHVSDDFIYFYRFKKSYNKIYDRMYQAGLKLSQMRVDEPFGSEAKKSLWLYHVIEPTTWSKLINRVMGVNSGSLYSKERGAITGNGKIQLPDGYTWKEYAQFILNSMPIHTSEHYKNKIAVYLKWYDKKGVQVIDYSNPKRSEDIPSWYLICKVLLKNDYWCTGLDFKVTKSDAYTKYLEKMKKKRSDWGYFTQ